MNNQKDEIAALAAAQSQLVRTFTEATDVFDSDRLELTASLLARKRCRNVQKSLPEIASLLGEKFEETFAEYASSHALPTQTSETDAKSFARWLRKHSASDPVRTAAAAEGLSRLKPVKFLRRRERFGLILLLRLPGG